MDVRRKIIITHAEAGQGVVEFLMLLPVMIAMVVILVRVNSAISTSIVNQKYVRMMIFRLNANSAQYPVFQQGADFQTNFADSGAGFFSNRMILGIANRPINETDNVPDAQTQIVARSPALSGGVGNPHEEPETRGIVRIRTTAEMCTQTNYVNTSGGKKPLAEDVMVENMVLDFCAAPVKGSG